MLWSIFTIIVLCTFGEPDRSGLEEQKRLEELSKGASPPMSPPDSPVVMIIDTEDSPGHVSKGKMDDDLQTIFTNDTGHTSGDDSIPNSIVLQPTCFQAFKARLKLITLPVRLCLFFLFCKTFCIEALVSATSSLTKNRYDWQVLQVGTLGCINGLLVIPLSIVVGWLSLYYQDRALMMFLVSIGCFGMSLLIDLTDLVSTPHSDGYNDWNKFAVHPPRYVAGYFLSFCSIQCFEGVIGSTLSKVIPTALASGTFNSGLLATLVDTVRSNLFCGRFQYSLVLVSHTVVLFCNIIAWKGRRRRLHFRCWEHQHTTVDEPLVHSCLYSFAHVSNPHSKELYDLSSIVQLVIATTIRRDNPLFTSSLLTTSLPGVR